MSIDSHIGCMGRWKFSLQLENSFQTTTRVTFDITNRHGYIIIPSVHGYMGGYNTWIHVWWYNNRWLICSQFQEQGGGQTESNTLI